jgi:sulfate adenylyltransferase subunit 2
MSKIAAILKELENESIEILRETAAGFKKPVMMYSIGKDSSVLLHLARKAFYPSPIPFPLLHVDTTWKFKEMISFRDRIVAETKSQLIVHTNQEGVESGISIHLIQMPLNTPRYEDCCSSPST